MQSWLLPAAGRPAEAGLASGGAAAAGRTCGARDAAAGGCGARLALLPRAHGAADDAGRAGGVA
jgi:hypothetical protein